MRNTILALFLLAAGAAAQTPGAQESVISLSDFSKCGFVSRFSPNKIDPQCFQDLNNAVLDQDYSILRRNGYVAYNATPCTGSQPIRGMWPFYATDGSQYVVFQSSQSMFYSKGDGTCTAITGLNGGLSATASMSCVQGLGQLWCTDGVDAVFKTNVVSTAVVSQAPLGAYIGFFRNRIIIAGVPSNLTSLYLSGELDGTDFTLPAVAVSTSSAILKINGVNDGLAISCLMGEFQNGYYIGRNYDTYLLSGYSLQDFTISRVDQQIGCMDNHSPQMVNNTLMWLSHRGVESLTGTQINWVSYPIDPTIKTVIQAAGNSQAFTVNSANFTTGNLTASGPGAPISSTIFPGNLTVSSATFVDNTTTTFAAGTLVNVSTYGTSGLYLAISSSTVFDGLLSGSGWTNVISGGGPVAYGFAANGTVITPCFAKPSVTVNCPNSAATCGYVVSNCSTAGRSQTYIEVVNGSSGASGSITASGTSSGGARTITVPLASVNTSSSIWVCITNDGNTCTIAGSQFASKEKATTPVGFNLMYDVTTDLQGNISLEEFSNVRVSSYAASGTYTSRSFDTSFSTPTMGVNTVAISSNSVGAVTLQEENSSDGSSWSSPSTLTNGNKALSGKRYWRYLENFTTTNGTTTANSNGIDSLNAETTGYYITPCANTTGNTSYGIMTVNAVNNGGAFTFWTSTGATCNAATATNATWNLQTANNIITQSTAAYIAARVLFSIDVASDTPVLNDLAFNWNVGASRPPVASAEYLNRYYLFYTTAQVTGAANDHAVVYDQNDHWQLYDDIHAASSSLYLNQLFLGDSSATGTAYLFDSGQDDSGKSFTFSFKTADMDGGDPVMLKNFNRAYLLIGAPSATSLQSALSCSYSLDGSSTLYSLGASTLSESPEQSGYYIAKFPFQSGLPSNGHWINLSCTNTGGSGPIQVYGIRLVYKNLDWQ